MPSQGHADIPVLEEPTASVRLMLPLAPRNAEAGGVETPIDVYLREQQQLTAVERFARQCDAGTAVAQARYYSALLPASPPGPGQQYAFDVDLDACSGCKACVTACHVLNGLDEQETWRDVGLLIGGTDTAPVMQHVTSSCHHCLEPACLEACPVDAYEKDPITGIVRHLDDQCFGCQYCTLACPYDVPKYHSGKGIVRKCDMCSQRLAVGEAPACVQSCPHEAIRISVVDQADVIANCETNLFLPGAPEPHQTLPTTSYRTRRVLPRNVIPADYFSVHPEHAHWSLIIMLVLTQLSVGAFVVDYLIGHLSQLSLPDSLRGIHAVSALALGLLALAASTCHLGRPLYAFRAVVGLRHSWLSREILAFGLFAACASAYAAVLWHSPGEVMAVDSIRRYLGGAVAATGIAGVGCSVMVYQFTRRQFWSGSRTGFRFFSTTVLLGAATSLFTGALAHHLLPDPDRLARFDLLNELLCTTILGAAGLRLTFDASIFRHLRSKQTTVMKRSALLQSGPLARVTTFRFACGVLGGLLVPAYLLATPSAAGALFPTTLLLISLTAGELAERYIFFAAVTAPRMPGSLKT